MALPPCHVECAKQLYQSRCFGGSDGSYDESIDICTAAWIIDFGQAGNIRGGGIVPSPEGQSNAYRGELGGLLGQLIIIESLERLVPPTRPYKVPISCNGKSALLQSLVTSREYFNSRQKSFDIISAIISIRERIRGTLVPTHVTGHQDDRGGELTHLEELNVKMDSLAKAILQDAAMADSQVMDALPITTDGLIQVDYQDIPITLNLAHTLQYQVNKTRIMEWWTFKHRFRDSVAMADIDWDVFRQVSRESSFEMGRFMSKWVSHHIAVGRMMEFRKAREHNRCPCCGHSKETTVHVLQCPAAPCRIQWGQGLHSLDK